MKAIVVYESLWGNTAEVARAIAEGIGSGAQALSTAQATLDVVASADLIVAGSPVLAFKMPTEQIRDSLRSTPLDAPAPADLSHPSMRSWLDGLPTGNARAAAFETRVRGPFGHATPEITKALAKAGYLSTTKPLSIIVMGKYGPLKDGELERARAWGAELAKGMG
jgi:flavodoxin